MKNSNFLLKILSLIGLILLTICFFILAKTPPATGYEISIYDAYPSYFWYFIIFVISSGIFILVYDAFEKPSFNIALMGVFLLLLGNFVILILPILRGYAFYGRDDAITHLGYVKDIIFTGHIGESNFYPLPHILILITSTISDLELQKVILIVTPIFYLVYCSGIFLLSRIVTKSLGQALLVIVFAISLPTGIYGTQCYPVGLSFMLIPFILYFFIRKIEMPSFQYTLLFVMLILAIVFLHPLTTLLLIPIFLIHAFSVVIYNHVKGYNESVLPIYLNPVLIVFVTLISWISSFVFFGTRVGGLFHWFGSEFKYSYIGMYQTAVEKASLTTYEFLELFFRMYGARLIYLIFFIVAVSIVLRKVFFGRFSLYEDEIFFTLVPTFFGLISLLFLFMGFNILGAPLRHLVIVFMGAAILNGLVLYEFIQKRKLKGKNLPIYLLIFMLIFSSILGIFNIHNSPYIKTPNQAVSYAEFAGGEWLPENEQLVKKVGLWEAGGGTKIIPIASQFGWRITSATLGYETASKVRSDIPPPHFGYHSNNSVRRAFTENVYIVITDFDRSYYTHLWPTQGAFYISDFEELNNDPTANFIYTNGGFDVWYIG